MNIHYKKFLSQSQIEETLSHKSKETNTSKNIKKKVHQEIKVKIQKVK